MQPYTYIATVLALFSYAAVIGGVFVTLGALVRIFLLRRLPLRLSQNRSEGGLLVASVVAGIFGCAWLFLAPAYVGSSCSVSMPSHNSVVTTTREKGTSSNGESIEVVSSFSSVRSVGSSADCEPKTKSFYEANGPKVIAPFTIPLALTLLPFVFYALRVRPIVEAFMATILGGQMAIGMSLYGVAFGPSGVLMLLAALAALRTNAAQQFVAADI